MALWPSCASSHVAYRLLSVDVLRGGEAARLPAAMASRVICAERTPEFTALWTPFTSRDQLVCTDKLSKTTIRHCLTLLTLVRPPVF